MDELDIEFAALSLEKAVANPCTAKGVCKEIHSILDTQFKGLLPHDEFDGIKLPYYCLYELTGFKDDTLSVSHEGNLLYMDMYVKPGAHTINGDIIYEDTINGEIIHEDTNGRTILLSLLFDEQPVQVDLLKKLDTRGRQSVTVTLHDATVQRAIDVLETLFACVFKVPIDYTC